MGSDDAVKRWNFFHDNYDFSCGMYGGRPPSPLPSEPKVGGRGVVSAPKLDKMPSGEPQAESTAESTAEFKAKTGKIF
eukprot:5729816-Prymnesium_polylepis.1